MQTWHNLCTHTQAALTQSHKMCSAIPDCGLGIICTFWQLSQQTHPCIWIIKLQWTSSKIWFTDQVHTSVWVFCIKMNIWVIFLSNVVRLRLICQSSLTGNLTDFTWLHTSHFMYLYASYVPICCMLFCSTWVLEKHFILQLYVKASWHTFHKSVLCFLLALISSLMSESNIIK